MVLEVEVAAESLENILFSSKDLLLRKFAVSRISHDLVDPDGSGIFELGGEEDAAEACDVEFRLVKLQTLVHFGSEVGVQDSACQNVSSWAFLI